MKKIFLLVFCVSLSIATHAQTSDAEAKAMANLSSLQHYAFVSFWVPRNESESGNHKRAKFTPTKKKITKSMPDSWWKWPTQSTGRNDTERV